VNCTLEEIPIGGFQCGRKNAGKAANELVDWLAE